MNGCNTFLTLFRLITTQAMHCVRFILTDNCFQNRGQYEAGFSDRLLLKNDTVPTLMGYTGLKPDAKRTLLKPPQWAHRGNHQRRSRSVPRGTLRDHVRSKGIQSTVGCLSVGTETMSG